jgi:UDP-GlcNAc:undecaprenyl-phosphate GlcNAc-1-phosphate transferase
MSVDIWKIIAIVVTTFVITVLITPIIKKIAFDIGSVDVPNARRVNKIPMPTLGGLGIFISFMVGYMLFCDEKIEMIPILLGGFVLILIGIFDGIKSLPAKIQFLGQLSAVLIVTVYGGLLIEKIDAFGITINFGIWAYPITIMFMLGMINSIKLIDGLDGLASGVSSIFFLTISIIAIILNKSSGLDILLALIMLGATSGFLVHNFYPAKIYLGETGSMFLGYIISVIAILGFKNVTLTSFIVPILIIGVPIFDTACAIIRRVLNKQPVFVADKKHLHHQLLNMNYSHRTTVLIIYYINALFALTSIIYILKDRVLGIIMYIVLFIIVFWFITKTSIIVNKKQTKKEKR